MLGASERELAKEFGVDVYTSNPYMKELLRSMARARMGGKGAVMVVKLLVPVAALASVAITAGVCALWLAYHGRDQLIQRYGASNLASVFKEILVTAGVDTPAGWDRQKYGAGILDASQVLEAPLPDTAPAGGLAAIHAGPVPRASNDLDVILTHFPALDPAAVLEDLRMVMESAFREQDAVLEWNIEGPLPAVRGDHHDSLGREAEQVAGLQVDLGVGLVMTGQLGG